MEERKHYKSATLCEMLFEKSDDSIFIGDVTGKILEVNESACGRLGYDRRELLSMSLKEIGSGKTFPPPSEAKQYFARQGNPNRETDLISKTGEVLPVEVNSRQILLDGQPVVVIVARDIGYRKKLEERLLRSQKLEAVGRLAGGIAHDFNNLMTAVISFSNFVLDSIDPDDPIRCDLVEIEKAGKKAAALTRQILAFSCKQILDIRTIDLNDLVRANASMLEKLMGERVAVILRLEKNLWPVKADSGQLELVLYNLAVNAKDAMPKGGKLEIRTKNIDADNNRGTASSDIAPGKYARLTVRDTGHGMDSETLSHIFEPFFTTKKKRNGTGLGLSTSYGIVSQTGGFMAAESERGRGAIFHLLFPRAASVGKKAALSPSIPIRELFGNETILIAEDEKIVRTLASRILTGHGYKCLTAKDGAEALKICEKEPGEIHVMLADIVMPGFTIRELATKVARIRPNMKILLMTGHSSDEISGYKLPEGKSDFLPKPFSPESLLTKIRQTLEKR